PYTRIMKLTLFLLFIPALAWGLIGVECRELFDGEDEPAYYWQVHGTVYVFTETETEAEALQPILEHAGYYDCMVHGIGPRNDLPGRWVVQCRWCQGEVMAP
ncbi:MAG: hypothetical protein ABIG63_17505, partial [Chloroflexota bacterium]